MLFNSFTFIFGFFPITLLAFYVAGKRRITAKTVLALLSLLFYAWWQPRYLPILIASIAFNYLIGAVIQNKFAARKMTAVTWWLTIGIVADVAALGWFKYANFAVHNLNAIGLHFSIPNVALPLAISFFTFQKIAYLVDTARGEARKMKFIDFTLFASFFPQLIAGPITHYKEIVPQFQRRSFGRLNWQNAMVGLAIFAVGLFKKTVIADTLSQYADPLYSGSGHMVFGALSGWLAAVTFTFQIYFDFSGYSDMAIGLARFFGIYLPLNFHSPLRARNIADYWRRWHMTLQRFIVAYIFQPLTVPLSRFAANRNYSESSAFVISTMLPLFLTFVVVGIWHGAGWTFVAFGVMHAMYVCIHQLWVSRKAKQRRMLRKQKRVMPEAGKLEILLCHVLTLLAVLFANVMFRAASVHQATAIWAGMAGLHGWEAIGLHAEIFNVGLWLALALSIALVFFMPNTQQIMGKFQPALNWSEWSKASRPVLAWTWSPTISGAAFVAIALFLGVMFVQRGQAIFIYFNF